MVNGLKSAMKSSSHSFPEQSQLNLPNRAAPSPDALSACKTSSVHIYMYGYGGTWDQLTHKYANISFCYTGSTATLSSHGGSCSGSDHGLWRWKVDGCYFTRVVWGQAAVVWREGRGDYHCDPTNVLPCSLGGGYYHSLYDTVSGYASGSSSCISSYSGTILAGVNKEYLVGCS